jgi:hypothetical protein
MKNLKIKIAIPSFENGNTLLLGIDSFKTECQCCGNTSFITEIGIVFLLIQFVYTKH